MTALHNPAETAGCPFAPGPKGKPGLGNLTEYQADPVGLSVRTARTYGPVAGLKIGPFAVTQVTAPEALEQVLQTRAKAYTRGKFYKGFELFMGKGLLTLDDEDWRRHRKVVRPAFQPRVIAEHTDLVRTDARTILAEWDGLAETGEPTDIIPAMMRYTLSVLGKTVLGYDVSDRFTEISHAVAFALPVVIKRISSVHRLVPRWIPTKHNRELNAVIETLDSVIAEVIAERRGEDPEHRRGDLVDLLLDSDLTGQEIRDNLITILLAGHETTGTGLAWMLHAIAQYPDVRDRLEAEVDAAVATGGALDATKLPYVGAVVDEALRMYPPIWQYPRDAAEPDVVGGYQVPKDSSVFVSVLATHHRPDLWPDPEAFDPSRFLDADGQRIDPPRYSYLPFGGGRRICIGQRLALLQMQVFLAELVRDYRVSLLPGQDLTPRAMLSLRPDNGIVMTISRRPR